MYLDEDNVRAGFRQANSDSLANAACAASNHGRMAL